MGGLCAMQFQSALCPEDEEKLQSFFRKLLVLRARSSGSLFIRSWLKTLIDPETRIKHSVLHSRQTVHFFCGD